MSTTNVLDFQREVIESKQPVLVDFWASWCQPCHAIAPLLDELAEEFAGEVSIVKVNVDEEAEVAAAYGIRAVPSLLLFQEGRVVDRLVGMNPKKKIRQLIQRSTT